MMPGNGYSILIVEDDGTIAELLRESLERWGFQAVCVEDFGDVLGTFRRETPHLVLLDISLPRYNGYYWCAEIRKESSVPILFLSSHTENMDVVMAMNMGGDDYVTKPFSMDVLIAKINALMRRAYSYYAAGQTLAARDAVLNLTDGTLSAPGGQVELSRNESRMLRLLMEHKNEIVTREALMRALWDDEHFIDENTLTVGINRLRKRLAGAGLDGFIQTRKGEGYIIRD
ncbi:response regulator transcription factor [Eubacteriales bacterium OttesenSCG-928-A19]|nr:response regulator transcription factor [Eubacteriales bacterium OttesenSCG-928-A19]